jgi:lipopolysaccharide/colanic/teichoic acid biosynthesis glycosyltransferase
VNSRTRFALSTLALDGLCLVVAGALVSHYLFGSVLPWSSVILGVSENIRPMVGLLVAGILGGSWLSIRVVERSFPRPSYVRAFSTVAFALLLVATASFFLRTYYSGRYTTLTLGAWLALALAHRLFRRRVRWVENLVVITDEKGLADDLADAPHAKVVDIHDPQGDPPPGSLPPGTTLVLDLRAALSDGMARFVSSSTMAGYEVRALSSVYEEHTGRSPLVHLAEGWEISVPLERRAPYAPFKRVIETILVAGTSPVWLLLGAAIWLAIRFDGPGRAIFRQPRVGRYGEPFTMYKFRTMVEGADDDGPTFTALDDPRITRVGRFLRATRLDEIPQLWNVLKGEVAIVGPRAEQVAFAQQFEVLIPFYRYRHLVRPGITGWAQVNSGYADDLEDTIVKLTYDLFYVRHMTAWLDLSIIWRTLETVFARRGAR